jgi:hypothetical protein
VVVDLTDPVATEAGRCGAEGAALARARQSGLPVPPGAVLVRGADVVGALDGLRRAWDALGTGVVVTVRIRSLRVDGIAEWERLLEAVADVRRAEGDDTAPVLIHRDVRSTTGGIFWRDGRIELVRGDPVTLADGLAAGEVVRLGPRAGRAGPLGPAARARLALLRRRARRVLAGAPAVLWQLDARGRPWVVGVR